MLAGRWLSRFGRTCALALLVCLAGCSAWSSPRTAGGGGAGRLARWLPDPNESFFSDKARELDRRLARPPAADWSSFGLSGPPPAPGDSDGL
ncbi:MAG: hypothetical protein KatS3mg110_3984 [Pirellulaceae bacterium]|nr:MAG: hypothetical protein KatS3mg110_3984 [Pirellulaceae bacterium]